MRGSPAEAAARLSGIERFCGSISGYPMCAATGERIVCDVYLGGSFGGRGDQVLGRVDLSPSGDGSRVELRVQTVYGWYDRVMRRWLAAMTDGPHAACP